MTITLMIPLMIGTWEWVIIVAVILLLFGGKKIPELMRGLGKGVQEFKKGVAEAKSELDKSDEEPEKKDHVAGKDK